MLFDKEVNYYGIPFGYGGFLLQKFCVKEFGVSIGRKIKLQKLKRKGSTQNKNVGRKGTAITYQNTKSLDIQPGEIITQLSFEPEEKERFGKRIDLGKSFKINKSMGINEDLTDLIDYISEILINNLTISGILEYCSSNDVPVSDVIYNGKIVYRDDDNKSLFSDRIYNYLSFDINNKMSVLF